MGAPSLAHSIVVSSLILVAGPLAVSAQGTIEGTVTFWGDPGGGTQLEVAAHTEPYSAPDVSVFVTVSGGPYSIPVPDGTYYIATLMARDGVFGEPRPEDVLSWYDADDDGDWDTVTISGGTVTGVDVDLGFVYVDIEATGANNGSSWADAYTDLQDGIDMAPSGVDVWVAEGTYVPGASRSDSFLTKAGVRVSGGFTGVETVRLERDWNTHPTILSGEIGSSNHDDNCYHVVRAEGSNPTALLDGVTITRGYADVSNTPDDQGGGIRARGGGVTLTNATVIDNYALSAGAGAMATLGGNIKAYNSSFINNHAFGGHGGGYFASVNSAQSQTLLNCVFTGNYAWRGGGIALESTGPAPVMVNLSVSNNSAGGEGGGLFTYSTQMFEFQNPIFWGNSSNTGVGHQISNWSTSPSISYGIVQDGWATGDHILTDDPSFADSELRLNLDSPAIDAADGSFIPRDDHDADADNFIDGPVSVDRDFNRRWVNIPYIPDTGPVDPGDDAMDMGAYEAVDTALIFWDGFESGDTDDWDNAVGGT